MQKPGRSVIIKWYNVAGFILFICLLFLGCFDTYEQRYDTFSDFEKANPRNKSWFPKIVPADAFDLKNSSSLANPVYAFGVFSYSKNNNYDSIFKKPDLIDFKYFQQKVEIHKLYKPGWFLDPDTVSKHKFETIKLDRFYIVRQVNQKKIYFIYTN